MKQQTQNTKQIKINKGQDGAGEHCNLNIRSIIQHVLEYGPCLESSATTTNLLDFSKLEQDILTKMYVLA
jgi:hypothetical protein